MFVAELQKRLREWQAPRSGIAALSFTNVAQQEIADRLGGHPPAPHYVGTLDSFMWRFVVRPFSHTVGVPRQGVRLIAGPITAHLDYPDVRIGPENVDRESIFRLELVGGADDKPVVARRHPISGKAESLRAPYNEWVLKAKTREWQSTGRVTHGDVKYLAARILNGKHGANIAALLARRFPILLVDELQDTGWFLGRALVALLRTPGIRSVLVGDPDQAIYGFGGADRTLLAQIAAIEGCRELPLRETHRCLTSIAAVATSLARSGVAVTTPMMQVSDERS